MKSLKLILVISIFVTSLNAQSYLEKVHPSVWSTMKDGKTEFFIVLKEQADISAAQFLDTKEEKGDYVFNQLKNKADKTQKDIKAFLNSKKAFYQAFWISNMLFAKGDRALIEALAQRDDVAEIVNNAHSRLDLPKTEINSAIQLNTRGASQLTWGVQKIKADSVWLLGYKGQNVVIAGEDTGYDWTHPAIKPKYRGWNGTAADHNYNWYDGIHADSSKKGNPCGYDIKAPCDDDRHGTHTMGTMIGANDTLSMGVAPDAKWIGARNMDKGDGTLQSYVDCFEFFLAPRDTNGKNPNPSKAPHVINNSWGCPASEGCNSSNFKILENAILACRAAGIVVVVSAGNSGSSCSSVGDAPAFFSKSFSIGATNSIDTIAGFSSRGPVTIDGSNRLKPNVSAPGVGVISCTPNNTLSSLSGTSMAGPHTAGTVALMISANPALAGQVDTIERILEQTAKAMITAQNCGTVLGTSIPNNTYGFGRIDALAAVKKGLLFKRVSRVTENKTQIKVYPNPFSSEITFFTEGVAADWQLQIFNINGQLMYSNHQNTSVFNVNLNNLNAGLYFYQLKNERETISGKLVKQ